MLLTCRAGDFNVAARPVQPVTVRGCNVLQSASVVVLNGIMRVMPFECKPSALTDCVPRSTFNDPVPSPGSPGTHPPAAGHTVHPLRELHHPEQNREPLSSLQDWM